MMSQRRQREIRKELQKLIRPTASGFDAILGDGAGNVEVDGKADQWYARPMGSDLPVVVMRGAAPKLEGVHVRIEPEYGADKRRRGNMRVVGVIAGGDPSYGEVEPHGETHIAGGSDPIYIDTVQIINGLVYATSGMNITVNAGFALINRQPVHWSKSDLDTSSYVPASGALYGLVRVDGDGDVDLQEGVAVASFADLSWEDVPRIADGYAALAIVRFYSGQSSLSRLYSNPDVIDIRFAPDNDSGDLWDAMAILENEIDLEISRHVLGW